MNLLDDTGSQKHYVASLMRESKLDNYKIEKKSLINRFANKKIISVFILSVFAILTPFTFMNGNFIVNADKLIQTSQPQILGEATALSLSSLVPKSRKSVVASFEEGDVKILAMRKYLRENSSELAPYADVIVKSAELTGIDYRLLVGISGPESGLCSAPTQSVSGNSRTYNCWGWNKKGKGFQEFSSYTQAIQTISKGISEVYGSNPSPRKMQGMYCTSCGDVNMSWQNYVNQIMSDIDRIYKEMVISK